MTPSSIAYACDRCGQPYCERILVLNLALDNVDDAYCLACLADIESTPDQALLARLRPYIQGRECFKTPWDKFDPGTCPLKPQGLCHDC